MHLIALQWLLRVHLLFIRSPPHAAPLHSSCTLSTLRNTQLPEAVLQLEMKSGSSSSMTHSRAFLCSLRLDCFVVSFPCQALLPAPFQITSPQAKNECNSISMHLFALQWLLRVHLLFIHPLPLATTPFPPALCHQVIRMPPACFVTVQMMTEVLLRKSRPWYGRRRVHGL